MGRFPRLSPLFWAALTSFGTREHCGTHSRAVDTPLGPLGSSVDRCWLWGDIGSLICFPRIPRLIPTLACSRVVRSGRRIPCRTFHAERRSVETTAMGVSTRPNRKSRGKKGVHSTGAASGRAAGGLHLERGTVESRRGALGSGALERTRVRLGPRARAPGTAVPGTAVCG